MLKNSRDAKPDYRRIARFAAGYIVGGLIFMIFIPSLICLVSVPMIPHLPVEITESRIVRITAALIFFATGILFIAWSNIVLLLTGRGGPSEAFGVEISPKSEILVKTGPYRFTRNPMVFGTFSTYISISVFINSFQSLLFVLLLLPLIILYLKKSEEKRLMKDFREDYLKYRERVSILIPLPPKKHVIHQDPD